MKRRLIQVGIGATLLIGGFGAEVVPQDMKPIMQYTYAPSDIGATTTPGYTFIDEDGNDSIAVAMFEDSKGKRVFEQIPDTQYEDMKKVDGYLENPKKTELVTLAAAFTTRANAAIAFVGESRGVRVSATSITWTCNFSGSNTIAFVTIGNNDITDVSASSLTVNGAAATFIDRNQVPGGGQGNMSLFYKVAPTNGNCAGTSLTGTDVLDGHMVSYSGVHQTVAFQSKSTNPDALFLSFDNPTTTVTNTAYYATTTPCANDSWSVWAVQVGVIGTNPHTSSNFIARSIAGDGHMGLGDNNAAITGGTQLVMSTTSASSITWEGIQASFAPVGATCPAVIVYPPRVNINSGSVNIQAGKTIVQ